MSSMRSIAATDNAAIRALPAPATDGARSPALMIRKSNQLAREQERRFVRDVDLAIGANRYAGCEGQRTR